MSKEPEKVEERKISDGVDRTLIRELLAMTPKERLDMIVESSRNLAALFAKKRILR